MISQNSGKNFKKISGAFLFSLSVYHKNQPVKAHNENKNLNFFYVSMFYKKWPSGIKLFVNNNNNNNNNNKICSVHISTLLGAQGTQNNCKMNAHKMHEDD